MRKSVAIFATGLAMTSAVAAARDADDRPLYQRVESDLDRGTGRIEDQQTYEVRRIQEPRLREQSEFSRFEQERDRRERIEAKARRTETARREQAAPSKDSATIVRETLETDPGALGSPLARYVSEQEQLLGTAREKYQRDLHQAEVDRDAAIRASKSREEQAIAARRFDERRAELTRAYQAYRKKILGR